MIARPVPKSQWKRMAEAFGVDFADVDGVRLVEGGGVQFRLKDGSIVERVNATLLELAGRTHESGGTDGVFIEAMRRGEL